jgi:hypothetical protein
MASWLKTPVRATAAALSTMEPPSFSTIVRKAAFTV